MASSLVSRIKWYVHVLFAPKLTHTSAWYFWNSKTGEVTWTNPIATAQDVIIPEGIDPALAHLLDKPDPNQITDPAYQQAKFNAKTGRFTAKDFELTPEYVSELGRMKRMNEMYFDTEEWERKVCTHFRQR